MRQTRPRTFLNIFLVLGTILAVVLLAQGALLELIPLVMLLVGLAFAFPHLWPDDALSPDDASGSCSACGTDRMATVARIELRGVPHGETGHDHGYRWRTLFACPSCGRGELHAHDHDCFTSYDADGNFEEWDMDWVYRLAPEEQARLALALEACPDPLQAECACAVHAALRASHPWGAKRGEANPLVVRIEGGLPVLEIRRDDGVDR